MFTGSYLSFQKSYPKKPRKVTRESIESYHYITKYKFPQIYINTAFAPMVLMLKAAAPCIKNARHCRQYKITNTNNNYFRTFEKLPNFSNNFHLKKILLFSVFYFLRWRNQDSWIRKIISPSYFFHIKIMKSYPELFLHKTGQIFMNENLIWKNYLQNKKIPFEK